MHTLLGWRNHETSQQENAFQPPLDTTEVFSEQLPRSSAQERLSK